MTAAAACSIVADAPPPPNGVRDVQRISWMPTLRMRASSSLVSSVKVTQPSMSDGSRPASPIAARTASAQSWSSLRPESLENSVWPIPTIAAPFLIEAISRPSPPRAGTEAARTPSTSANTTSTGTVVLHVGERRCPGGSRPTVCPRPARSVPRSSPRHPVHSGGGRRSSCAPFPDRRGATTVPLQRAAVAGTWATGDAGVAGSGRTGGPAVVPRRARSRRTRRLGPASAQWRGARHLLPEGNSAYYAQPVRTYSASLLERNSSVMRFG